MCSITLLRTNQLIYTNLIPLPLRNVNVNNHQLTTMENNRYKIEHLMVVCIQYMSLIIDKNIQLSSHQYQSIITIEKWILLCYHREWIFIVCLCFCMYTIKCKHMLYRNHGKDYNRYVDLYYDNKY